MKFTRNHIILLASFALAAVIVTLQSYYSPLKELWGGQYTTYNNYIIFKSSFHHLVQHSNLYAQYASEYADYYKYSPTFALLFAPFGFFPDGPGLALWNLLNALLLLMAFFSLKNEVRGVKLLYFVFLLVDVVTSMQNSQSNALMAGLLILAYTRLKKGNYFFSSLLISIGVMIKIYAGLGFLLLFFAGRKQKFFVYSVACTTALILLPAVLIGFKELWWQYGNWKELLSWDMNASAGTSLIGIAGLVLPADAVRLPVQLAGLVLLLLPLLVVKNRDEKFERNYLAFVLVWMVLFNHKAESPAFVIAFAGATLWIMNQLQNRLALVVYIIAFVLGCLTSTDIFPPDVRRYFLSVHMKAFAYVPIMIVMYTGFFSASSRAVPQRT